MRVLITGHMGLIGSAVTTVLRGSGVEVTGLDIADPADPADVTDYDTVRDRMTDVAGVVNFAAVSRVITGQRDPQRCMAVNIGGIANILHAQAEAHRPPWVIHASSREVYGQAEPLPVDEDYPYRPMNVYARSKVTAEHLIWEARQFGNPGSVIRFSSVYGSTADHADRVAPAFARAAAEGGTLRVEGAENMIDLTHIRDVAEGVRRAVMLAPAIPFAMHLTTGEGTTLKRLALLAVDAAGKGTIEYAPPRAWDVGQFTGDPYLAKRIIGWDPEITIETGMRQFVGTFRAEAYAASITEPSPMA